MRRLFVLLPEKSEGDIEIAMRAVSLSISLASLGLMAGGLLYLLYEGSRITLPGLPTVPLTVLVRLQGAPAGALAMSAGVMLLALLPAVRVILALGIYLRRNARLDALVAVIVIVELLFSMHISRGA